MLIMIRWPKEWAKKNTIKDRFNVWLAVAYLQLADHAKKETNVLDDVLCELLQSLHFRLEQSFFRKAPKESFWTSEGADKTGAIFHSLQAIPVEGGLAKGLQQILKETLAQRIDALTIQPWHGDAAGDPLQTCLNSE